MRHSYRRQAGATLIEILAALAVISATMVGFAVLMQTMADDAKGQQTAIYQSTLTRAVRGYVENAGNRSTIMGAATTATPMKITLAMLAQWLPPNTSAANPYLQSPCVLAYYDTVSGRIDVAVTTEGGATIDDGQLGYIVTHAGEGAGAIYARTPAQARGGYGGWQTPVATFTDASAAKRCGAAPANAGRMFSLLSFDQSGTLASDWLARNVIPGRPDMNRMNTHLDMGANNVNNALNVSAANDIGAGRHIYANNDIVAMTGRVIAPNGLVAGDDVIAMSATMPSGSPAKLSQAVFYESVVANGGAVAKPSCPAGSTPQFTATPVNVATEPPRAIYATYVSVIDGGASWAPVLYVYTTPGTWRLANSGITRLKVSAKCS